MVIEDFKLVPVCVTEKLAGYGGFITKRFSKTTLGQYGFKIDELIVHTHTLVHMHIRTYTHMHAHTRMHTHTHTHTHTPTNINDYRFTIRL